VAEIEQALRLGADAVVSKDLLSQPDQWAERLREILPARDGQVSADSVSSHQRTTEDRRDGIVADLEQTWRNLPTPLSPQLVPLLLRRGLASLGKNLTKWDGVDTAFRDSSQGFKRLARAVRPETLSFIAQALHQQLRYVFGAMSIVRERLDTMG
jgi:hypothetical protein